MQEESLAKNGPDRLHPDLLGEAKLRLLRNLFKAGQTNEWILGDLNIEGILGICSGIDCQPATGFVDKHNHDNFASSLRFAKLDQSVFLNRTYLIGTIHLGHIGLHDEDLLIIALQIGREKEKAGTVWRVTLGKPTELFPILEPNNDFLPIARFLNA